MSVGPEFEWSCPFCSEPCTDDIPVVVDKFMLNILRTNGPRSGKTFFQIMSDGQICDDSASESETESEDEEKFEDETP